jgi:microcystin-dependent protein
LTNRVVGETGGEAQVTLLQSEMPAHIHRASASTNASTASDPTNSVWAVGGQTRGGVPLYSANANPPAPMNPAALSIVGGDQPHNNMPPGLGLTFIIALQGIYPPRS